MAYDLLSRKQTPANWSRYSRCGARRLGVMRSGRRPSRTMFLAEYTFAPDPLPTTDEEKQVIARLAVLKMKVDAGDKKALKEWRVAGKKIVVAKKKADLGDVKAKRLMQVLSESGIFDGVQKMEA